MARRRAAERERMNVPANWGLDHDALRLPANSEVETRNDGPPARARRLDVFDLLFARGSLGQAALDAARRLQADVTALHARPGGVGAYAERVDRSRSDSGLDECALSAGSRITRVSALTGQASARLLLALCEAGEALRPGGGWRGLVQSHTGERLADAQSAVVRSACENLAEAYAILDRRRPQRTC
jgi:hypothetical protein